MAINIDNLEYPGCGGSVGTDPEIFVVGGNGSIIPAFTFLEDQNKKDPPLTSTNTYHLHNDGFQAEFTVLPSTCLSWVVDRTQYAMKDLLQRARKIDPKATLSTDPIIDVPPEILLAAPAKYIRMGCAPSSNIHHIHGVEIANGKEIPIRFAGCHIHIEIAPLFQKMPHLQDMVFALDSLVGIASVALFGGKKEKTRRQYYGLPGEFRLPKHGIEYRTVSSAMLQHPVYFHFLMDLARFAVNTVTFEKYILKDWFSTPIDTVVKCILSGSKTAAQRIIKREPVFKFMIERRYYTDVHHSIYDVLIGKRALVGAKGNIVNNWYLDDVYDPQRDTKMTWWISHSEAPNCSVNKLQLV